MKREDIYSEVSVDVCDNTIYLEDLDDGHIIAINPECWGLIKETVDQNIADGYLQDS